MLTPCLGRERVHLQLDDALSSARWVSVVGPPGSGKTLLVRHLAARTEPSTWVNAQGLRTSDAILAACLHGVGAEAAPGDSTRGALGRALDGTETLLVVDGVDIDADGLGPALQELVETTSGARIAVTARTMAGQPGERVVRVGPLPVPSTHEPLAGPAVDLFLHRVEAAGGHPVDLVAHERDVRRLLTATGGLPLLIEQMAVQIALVGLTNVVPTASLSEAVQASYELLDEEQRRCFRRLAQMTTPVSIDVLAAVVGVERDEAAGLAAGLARRSLLEVLPDGHLSMLSPIRRHGAFLTASTDDASAAARGPDPVGRPGRPRRPQLRGRRRPLARGPEGDARRDQRCRRRAGDARPRLRAGQPRLLLALHRHAGPRGRRDPRGGHRQRRRPGHDRRPGRPPRGDRGLGGARHLRGHVAPRALRPARRHRARPGPRAGPQRRDPRRDAPRRRGAGAVRGRGPARDRARPDRPRRGRRAAHPGRHPGLARRVRRGRRDVPSASTRCRRPPSRASSPCRCAP